MRQSQNIKASPNQLETFAVDHDRMNSSLHQDRSAAVIEKSKVKSLYSQPSSVSVKAGSVALQPVFGDLKQKSESEVSFKPDHQSSIHEPPVESQLPKTPITFYLTNTSKSSVVCHKKSSRGIYTGNAIAIHIQHEKGVEPMEPAILKGNQIACQYVDQSRPAQNMHSQSQQRVSITGVITSSQYADSGGHEQLSVHARRMELSPFRKRRSEALNQHRISVAMENPYNLRRKTTSDQNNDLWTHMPVTQSARGFESKSNKKDMAAQTGENTDEELLAENKTDKPYATETNENVQLQKLLAHRQASAQGSADSESQYTAMEPMLRSFEGTTKSQHIHTQQTFTADAAPNVVVPQIIKIDELVCKTFDEAAGFVIKQKIEEDSVTPQVAPLKIQVHEVRVRGNDQDNVRVINNAMIQGRQRLLSKKRAALMRHKSQKFNHSTIPEEKSAIPSVHQTLMLPDSTAKLSDQGDLAKTIKDFTSLMNEIRPTKTPASGENTQKHLSKDSLHRSDTAKIPFNDVSQDISQDRSQDELVSRFNNDLNPLFKNPMAFSKGQSTDAMQSKAETHETPINADKQLKLKPDRPYNELRDSFVQVQLTHMTYIDSPRAGPQIGLKDETEHSFADPIEIAKAHETPHPKSQQKKRRTQNTFMYRYQKGKRSHSQVSQDQLTTDIQALGANVKLAQRVQEKKSKNHSLLKPIMVYCDVAASQKICTEEKVESLRERMFESEKKSPEIKRNPLVVDRNQYNFSSFEFDQVKERNLTLISQFHHQVPAKPVATSQVVHSQTNLVQHNKEPSVHTRSKKSFRSSKMSQQKHTHHHSIEMIRPDSAKDMISLYRKSAYQDADINQSNYESKRTRPLTAAITKQAKLESNRLGKIVIVETKPSDEMRSGEQTQVRISTSSAVFKGKPSEKEQPQFIIPQVQERPKSRESLDMFSLENVTGNLTPLEQQLERPTLLIARDMTASGSDSPESIREQTQLSQEPSQAIIICDETIKQRRVKSNSGPRIHFVESYASDQYKDHRGIIDRKRMEFEQYMLHRSKQEHRQTRLRKISEKLQRQQKDQNRTQQLLVQLKQQLNTGASREIPILHFPSKSDFRSTEQSRQDSNLNSQQRCTSVETLANFKISNSCESLVHVMRNRAIQETSGLIAAAKSNLRSHESGTKRREMLVEEAYQIPRTTEGMSRQSHNNSKRTLRGQSTELQLKQSVTKRPGAQKWPSMCERGEIRIY